MNNQQTAYDARLKRVMDAVALREGDRVPFVPTVNNFYALHYGITIQDAMTNVLVLKDAIQTYLQEYDPDLVYSPGGSFFPIAPMETVGYTNAKWPGAYWNLPENTPYQYIDSSYLGEDDYEQYLRDPSDFLMRHVLPQKFKNLAGLSMMNLPAFCGQAIYSLAALGLPQVQQTLQTMLTAGRQITEALERAAQMSAAIVEAGYPVFADAAASCPFDDFADNVRGLLDTCMDILEDPDAVNDALDRWGDMTIPAAVELAKRSHQNFAFIPLHCGTDNFMSTANYEKCYWPHLKRLMMAYIDAGITPFVFCEGSYNNRLHTIADIPKGKVIYAFEKVDMKTAKAVLGDTACIAGAFPTLLLMNGHKPEEVRDKVKEMMDICAPGGGFIMSNSVALDDVDPALMHAWRDATEQYGKF